MKNTIEDLRNHLFEVIERLKEGDESMPLERAETIASVADAIIRSARAEVDFMRVTGGRARTRFIELEEKTEGVRVHRLK